jgi:hypothetical protein
MRVCVYSFLPSTRPGGGFVYAPCPNENVPPESPTQSALLISAPNIGAALIVICYGAHFYSMPLAPHSNDAPVNGVS